MTSKTRLHLSRLAPSICLSLTAILLTTLVTPSPLAAGTTGKIAGTVKDAKTNEPLAGASVVIEGSRLGARTDADGNYTVLNVAPGTYRVRASYVGYQPQTVANISIRADFTSRVEFNLSAEGVVAKEVSVTAERPLIIKDQTSTVAVVTAEQIRALPVENFDQVVSLQAGVVDGRFRGGRLGEVAYIVDGVAVQDVFDGGKGGARTVEPAAIQELQVITGAFNAEYGQALSGVVSIVTKDGGAEKLAGNLTVYTGSYVSARGDVFQNITAPNPVSSPNIQGSLGGPIPGFGEKLTFFVSGRGFYNEGYFFGTRQYRPTDVLSQNNPDNPFGLSRTNDALPAIRGYFLRGGAPGSANTYTFRDKTGNPYIGADGQPLTVATGPDGKAIIDRQNGMPMYIPYYVVGTDRDGVLGVLNNYQNLGTGDGKTVPLAPFTRYSGQGKLTFRPFERLKISANALYENETSQGYDIGFSRNPDGNTTGYREGLTAYLTTNYTLSSSTFVEAIVSNFWYRTRDYAFADLTVADPFDLGSTGYVNPDVFSAGVGEGFIFLPAGVKTGRFDRSTQTVGVKASVNSQLDNLNLIKVGFELKQHTLTYDQANIRNAVPNNQPFVPEVPPSDEFGHDFYVRNPTEFSAYVQDKIEFPNLIINAGIRFDYFDAQSFVPRDPEDPSAFRPIKSDEQYLQDNGTLERSVRASPKFAISGRLGVSMPIGDRGLFRFSVGQFFQIPAFENLYRNVLYKLSENEVATGITNPFGNADIKPQRTTSYEIGLQQQVGNDLAFEFTAYIRDIRDLSGPARFNQFSTGAVYFTIDNTDYALATGFIVRIDKRLSQSFSFAANYTFQFAEGNAFNSGEAFNAALAGKTPEKQLIPLEWDQRHTLNGELVFNNNGLNVGLIGRFGSGLPYTPQVLPGQLGGVSQILNNSQQRPITVSFDVRATKDFFVAGATVQAFLQVFNLLDTPNETQVYGTTGRAGYQIIPVQSPVQTLNTFAETQIRPDFYSEPRRVSLGFTFNF